MKKLALAAVLLLIALLIAPLFTGKLLQEGQVQALARQSQSNPNLDISAEQTASGWFSSDYQYKVSMILDGDDQPTTFDIYATHFHGPLSIGAVTRGQIPSLGLSSYTWRGDLFAQWANALADDDPDTSELLSRLPGLKGSGVVWFDGSTNNHAVLEAFTIENTDGSISSSDVTLHAASKPNGEISSAAVTVDQLSGASVDQSGESIFNIKQLNLNFAAVSSLAGMPIGDGELQLESLTIKSPGVDFDAQRLSSTSIVNLDNDLLSYDTQFDVESIRYQDAHIGQSSINASYSNLHLPTLLVMQHINAKYAPPADASEAEVEALLVQQGTVSQTAMLELLLHKPSLTSQWNIAAYDDNVVLDFALNLDSISEKHSAVMRRDPALGLRQIGNLAAGTLDLSAPAALADAVAAFVVEKQADQMAAETGSADMSPEQKQQLTQMLRQTPITMGYVSETDGKVKTLVEMTKGQVTINGRPFPLIHLISQYASQQAQAGADQ